MNSTTNSLLQRWRNAFGDNPFGWAAFGLSTALIIASCLLLMMTVLTLSAQTRVSLVLVVFGIAMLGPIPVVLALIFSRRWEVVDSMRAGERWAHWEYEARERLRCARYLPRKASGVDLSDTGVHWHGRGFNLVDFRSGLSAVGLLYDDFENIHLITFEYFFRRRSQYGLILHTDHRTLHVPVPQGREDEAQVLVDRYQKILGRPSAVLDGEWRLAIRYGLAMPFLLIPLLLLMFPLSSQAIREEFDQRATVAQVRREEDIAVARAAYLRIASDLARAYELTHAASASGWIQASPGSLGFDAESNLSEIHYGRCSADSEFYFFAVEHDKTMDYGEADPGGFVASTAEHAHLSECVPPGYEFAYRWENMGANWSYAVLQRDRSGLMTAIAPLVATLTALPSDVP